jgi:hypothetical protein
LIGKATGELVWLKHPTNSSNIRDPWELNVLIEGPDVSTIIRKCDIVGSNGSKITNLRACVF